MEICILIVILLLNLWILDRQGEMVETLVKNQKHIYKFLKNMEEEK